MDCQTKIEIMYSSVVDVNLPIHSMFRYYIPNTNLHYTALKLADGSILQVKTPEGSCKRRFENMDSWRATLPAGCKGESEILLDWKEKGWKMDTTYKQLSYSKWTGNAFHTIRRYKPDALNDTKARDAYNRLTTILEQSDITYYVGHFGSMSNNPFETSRSPIYHCSTLHDNKEMQDAYKELYEAIGQEVSTLYKKTNELIQLKKNLPYIERRLFQHKRLYEWYNAQYGRTKELIVLRECEMTQ